MIVVGFATEEFCRRAVQAFNADTDANAAAQGWSGDFGFVIDRHGEPLVVHIGAPVNGVMPDPQFPTLPELILKSPVYFARASEATWQGLLTGTVDPVAAIVQKQLEARGDLTPVIKRLKYRGLLERWLTRVTQGGLT